MKEKNKRGQLSLFIIIAIVLIIIVISSFFIVQFQQKKNPLFEPVESFIQSCVEETVDESVVGLSMQGGYYNKEPSGSYLLFKVPYYFDNGKINVPSKNDIEKEFSDYIENGIINCIDDFKNFKEQEYDIIAGNPSVITSPFSNSRIKYF